GPGRSVEGRDWNGSAEFVEGLAEVAAARGNLESARRLWAASRRHFDESGELSWNAAETERGLAQARASLGEAKFEEAWRSGQALTRDDAVALATRIAADAQGAVPAY